MADDEIWLTLFIFDLCVCRPCVSFVRVCVCMYVCGCLCVCVRWDRGVVICLCVCVCFRRDRGGHDLFVCSFRLDHGS